MSEEEKEAIEIIKKEITKPETTPLEVYVTDIKMLLHIIDKQQKEIEELKDNLEKFEVSYALCVNDRDSKAEMIKNSISKNIIRNKIKELEEIGQMLTAEQGYWGSPKLLNQMEILKELLGE